MYQINFAADGFSTETHEKEYENADSALRAGKRLLVNQSGGSVAIYETNGSEDPVRYAKKSNWKWTNKKV